MLNCTLQKPIYIQVLQFFFNAKSNGHVNSLLKNMP